MLVIVFRPEGNHAEDKKDLYLMMVPTSQTPASMLHQLWSNDFRLAKIFDDSQLAALAFDRIKCSMLTCQKCRVCRYTSDKTKIPPPQQPGTVSVMRIELTQPVIALRVE